MFEDQVLTCIECRCEFVWTAGEQQFYAARAFTAPRRCSSCRQARLERLGERSVRVFDR
jgi:hypothetical protein